MITLTWFFGFQLGQSFAHPAFYLPISLLERCFFLVETYYCCVLLSAMLYFLRVGRVGEREAMILQVRWFFHDDGSYLWVWVWVVVMFLSVPASVLNVSHIVSLLGASITVPSVSPSIPILCCYPFLPFSSSSMQLSIYNILSTTCSSFPFSPFIYDPIISALLYTFHILYRFWY